MLRIDNLRLRPGAPSSCFELQQGETCVLLGRNNSGKTNFLRLVAGLSGAASGTVEFNGDQAVPTTNHSANPAAFVFQAFVNYPHWTVRQNLESPLRAQRCAAKERAEQVQRVAETLQIDELLDRLPAQLSGGQQQRVALGRALCKRAPVVLLDEPFVNLDFRLRERLTRELGELLRDTNTAAIFATSDSRDAFALGDRVALLVDGQILQNGPPLALYSEPNSWRAADLMGEPGVNRLVTEQGLLVVRPEHLTLAKPANEPGELAAAQAFTLRVEAVETNGSHSFVQGSLITEAQAQTAWVAKLTGVPEVHVGSTVVLHAQHGNLLHFNEPGAWST